MLKRHTGGTFWRTSESKSTSKRWSGHTCVEREEYFLRTVILHNFSHHTIIQVIPCWNWKNCNYQNTKIEAGDFPIPINLQNWQLIILSNLVKIHSHWIFMIWSYSVIAINIYLLKYYQVMGNFWSKPFLNAHYRVTYKWLCYW